MPSSDEREERDEWVTDLARLLDALQRMREECATLREDLRMLRADIAQERERAGERAPDSNTL